MSEGSQKRSALFWIAVATGIAVLILAVAITVAILLSPPAAPFIQQLDQPS